MTEEITMENIVDVEAEIIPNHDVFKADLAKQNMADNVMKANEASKESQKEEEFFKWFMRFNNKQRRKMAKEMGIDWKALPKISKAGSKLYTDMVQGKLKFPVDFPTTVE